MSLARPRTLNANSEHNLRAALRETEEYYACQPKRPPEAEQLMAWMNLTKYTTERKIRMIEDVMGAAKFKISAYARYDAASAAVYETLYRRAEAMRDAAQADISSYHDANAREVMRLHHPRLESRLHPNWPQMLLRR